MIGDPMVDIATMRMRHTVEAMPGELPDLIRRVGPFNLGALAGARIGADLPRAVRVEWFACERCPSSDELG